MGDIQNINPGFYEDIRNIIIESRNNAIRSVDFHRVMMYWRIGERTLVEEQHGEERAKYGEQLLKNLAAKLENEFGSGFSYRQLACARKFYRVYPIVNALRSQLNWSQYRLLISIDDDYAKGLGIKLRAFDNPFQTSDVALGLYIPVR